MIAPALLLSVMIAAAADVEMLEQQAFTAAVARVAPSVVRIETIGGHQKVGRVLLGDGPTTGMVIDADGYLVSSAFNFIHKPTSILVRLPDATLKPAKLVATDHHRMLVLLKIDVDEPLPVPEFTAQDELRVGQWAIALGRTFELERPNISVGIVSAVRRVWGKALQTDAAVSPNNYGGPLIDVRGRVLGLLVPLSPQSVSEVAGYEWYDSGIGFAVPAEEILKILPRLREGTDLRGGIIGISLQGNNPSIGEPVIAACRPNSPAAEAGLKVGDRIVEIDGREITRAAGVKEQLARHYAGDTAHVIVLRDDKRIEYDVELVAKLEPYQHAMLGILPMRPFRQDDAEKQTGVEVRWVYPQGPAAAAEIVAGDLLVSLAGKPISDAAELRKTIARDHRVGEEVALDVRRGSDVLELKVRLDPLPEDLPPQELPPAGAYREPEDGEPEDGGQAETGIVELKIDKAKNSVRAYVPEYYDAAEPHGVAVWLHAPDEFDFDALLRQWKPHCDAANLILVAPESADPKKWAPGDVATVGKVLDEVASTYTVDPARVALLGHKGGGTTAYVAALANRDKVRAVALVGGALTGRPPDNEPLRRLAVYVARAKDSPGAAALKKAIALLREKKIPVTEKDLGQEPRPLNDDELAELVRWIDMQDRI